MGRRWAASTRMPRPTLPRGNGHRLGYHEPVGRSPLRRSGQRRLPPAEPRRPLRRTVVVGDRRRPQPLYRPRQPGRRREFRTVAERRTTQPGSLRQHLRGVPQHGRGTALPHRSLAQRAGELRRSTPSELVLGAAAPRDPGRSGILDRCRHLVGHDRGGPRGRRRNLSLVHDGRPFLPRHALARAAFLGSDAQRRVSEHLHDAERRGVRILRERCRYPGGCVLHRPRHGGRPRRHVRDPDRFAPGDLRHARPRTRRHRLLRHGPLRTRNRVHRVPARQRHRKPTRHRARRPGFRRNADRLPLVGRARPHVDIPPRRSDRAAVPGPDGRRRPRRHLPLLVDRLLFLQRHRASDAQGGDTHLPGRRSDVRIRPRSETAGATELPPTIPRATGATA